MASIRKRGFSYSVVYTYKEKYKTKQHWETYNNELEAIQRKAYIDYLQKKGLYADVRTEALKYKNARTIGKELGIAFSMEESINKTKTYGQFIEKWLPHHTKKNRISPNTYDSYASNLKNHIVPYFENKILSTITAEDIDDFIIFLSSKPVMKKGNLEDSGEIKCLSSSTIKKCYNLIMSSLRTAKSWGYLDELPDVTGPAETYKKRAFWDIKQVATFVINAQDHLLRFAVSLAFLASMRAGEVVGIDTRTINEEEMSFMITQSVQRVSNESLAVIPRDRIISAFPKRVDKSLSTLILTPPKTKSSIRKVLITDFMLMDVKQRLREIQQHKEFFGAEYQNHNLLVCYEDGRPIEPKRLNRLFQKEQERQGITDKIQFHGLRKSGQMLKIRLSDFDFQSVAKATGLSVAVLLEHYDEALLPEIRELTNSMGASWDSFGARAYPPLCLRESTDLSNR